jgi:hypothetical protein
MEVLQLIYLLLIMVEVRVVLALPIVGTVEEVEDILEFDLGQPITWWQGVEAGVEQVELVMVNTEELEGEPQDRMALHTLLLLRERGEHKVLVVQEEQEVHLGPQEFSLLQDILELIHTVEGEEVDGGVEEAEHILNPTTWVGVEAVLDILDLV